MTAKPAVIPYAVAKSWYAVTGEICSDSNAQLRELTGIDSK
jgi:hypothetical protein